MQCKVTSPSKRRFFSREDTPLCVIASTVKKPAVCTIILTAEELAQHSQLGQARVATVTFSQALGRSGVLKTLV